MIFMNRTINAPGIYACIFVNKNILFYLYFFAPPSLLTLQFLNCFFILVKERYGNKYKNVNVNRDGSAKKYTTRVVQTIKFLHLLL